MEQSATGSAFTTFRPTRCSVRWVLRDILPKLRLTTHARPLQHRRPHRIIWLAPGAAPMLCRYWSQTTPTIKDLIISPKSLRSEEHTSELKYLIRISYAVFCSQ